MSDIIGKHHLRLNRLEYEVRLREGFYSASWQSGLRIAEIDPDYDVFKSMLDRIEWGWENQERNQEGPLRERLAQPGTRLFLLYDDSEDRTEPIGFALVVKPDDAVRQKYWGADSSIDVTEIEYLALFPGREGKGRGRAFFEMLFIEVFEQSDAVYWTVSESNRAGLIPYYMAKMGMEHLGKTPQPKFAVPVKTPIT